MQTHSAMCFAPGCDQGRNTSKPEAATVFGSCRPPVYNACTASWRRSPDPNPARSANLEALVRLRYNSRFCQYLQLS